MTWANKASYPVSPGVSFQEMAQLDNGLILVVGGEHLVSNNDTLNPNCYLYDPNADSWALTGALNTLRVTPNLVKLNDGRVLCVGGRSKISDGDSLSSCEVYDPNTQLWTVTGSLNVGRYRPAIWKLNSGDVLIAGGLTGAPGFTPVASTELYSVSGGTWTDTGHALYQPVAECYFFSLTDGTPVIAAGQYLSSGFNGSYKYNSSTGWQTLDALNPSGITASDTGRVCVLTSGDILIAGVAGSTGGQLNLSQTTTMIFHQQSQTWETVGNLNDRRQDAIIAALPNDAAFISGGFVDPYAGVLVGELYDPIAKTWSVNSAYSLDTQQTYASYVPATLTNNTIGVFAIGGWDVSGYPSSLVTVANNRFIQTRRTPMAFVQGFYSDQTVTALSGSYQQLAFGIEATQVVIQNDDGTNAIYFSWDGVHNHGQLLKGETLVLRTSNYEQIYLKGAAGTPAYRLTAIR